MERTKYPALFLLLIPIQLVIDFAAVWAAQKLDVIMATQNIKVMGYQLPGMTAVVTIAFSIVTIFVTVEAVGWAIMGLINNMRKKRDIDE